ncbi:MAG: hypothetical protein OEW00_04180, partial [candidate division Zixibacteria bacterium]|nr:hypothetical protein [candidate division Zixibacteria bacterium]
MHRLIISLFTAAVFLSVMAVPIFAASQQVAASRAPQPERIMFHSQYGTAEMISGNFIITASGTRLDKTLAFIASRPEAFRMASPGNELELLSEKTDRFGRTHLRFQQVYEGLPVWGCQTIVHFQDEQTIYLVGGQTIPTPALSTSPAIAEAEAGATAVAELRDQYSPDELQTEARLVIYPNDGEPRLAQLVTVTGTRSGAVRWLVFVDAQTGVILHKFSDIHFDGPDTGSGPDVHNVTQTFPIYLQGTQYKMINTTRNAVINTYEDYYDGGPISTDPDGDKVWDDNVGQKAAVSGHFNADLVVAYFWDTFGRNSYDDDGHSLMVNVHDSVYINNAYW